MSGLLQDGVISGCRVTSFLLEKSRIVSHAPEERNFHVFYEMLAGLAPEQRERYGLMSHEKYFYLNQVCTILFVHICSVVLSLLGLF